MNVAVIYMNNECNVGRGAGYIAGAVARAGHELCFFDTFFDSPREIVRSMRDRSCEIALVSSMTMMFPRALELIGQLKSDCGVPVLVGGIHPTIVGPRLMAEHPEIDYLCVGEGESMVREFLERFGTQAALDVPNLVYRRDGEIVANPVRPAEDLAETGAFPWHLFRAEAIVQEHGLLYVNATRGCPFDCTYCCNGIYLEHYGGRYLRFRPVEQVMDELHLLRRQYDPKLFYFGDEMIFADKAYAAELFRTIKRDMGIDYGCMSRVEFIKADTVALLEETGCKYVGMGIECGDEAFRREHLNRKMSNTQIEQAFKLVKDAGIFTTSFNMIGYPFDHDDDLTEATLELNQRIGPDYAQVSIFYPFPGTRLYDRCVESDLIDPEKLAVTSDYFRESVLRNVSLAERRAQVDRLLNPLGFRFGRPRDAALVAELAREIESLRKRLEQTESRRQAAETSCADTEARCASMEARLQQLNDMLEEKERQRDAAERTCASYEENLRRIQTLLDEQERQRAFAEQTCASLETQLEQLKAAMQERELSCSSLQGRLKVTVETLERTEASRNAAESAYASLGGELQELRRSLETRCRQLEAELAAKTGARAGAQECVRSIVRRWRIPRNGTESARVAQ